MLRYRAARRPAHASTTPTRSLQRDVLDQREFGDYRVAKAIFRNQRRLPACVHSAIGRCHAPCDCAEQPVVTGMFERGNTQDLTLSQLQRDIDNTCDT